MKLVAAVVSVLTVALVGCVDVTAHQAVTADASADLDCQDLAITVLSQTAGPEQPSIVNYRVTGCTQIARYKCEDDHQTPSVNYTCTLQAHTTVSSQVTIDGAPLVPDGDQVCRSGTGENQDFYGVDLAQPGGDTLRLERDPDLTYGVIVIGADGTNSPLMQGCANVDIASDPLAGLTGDATFACAQGTWTVNGTVSFAGCE